MPAALLLLRNSFYLPLEGLFVKDRTRLLKTNLIDLFIISL